MGHSHLSQDPFRLGVASGAPSADSVVLWTRLLFSAARDTTTAAPVDVRWEIAHDEKFAQLVQSGIASASASLAHSVHVVVQGPEAKVSKLRLAYTSCQKWEDGYFTAWRHMKEERLDAVMFLGDYIYGRNSALCSCRYPAQRLWSR